ncbi:MAG: hypothetical protein QM790_12840 [Nibricoccus sp.]
MSAKGQGSILGVAIAVAVLLVAGVVFLATRVRPPRLVQAQPSNPAIPQILIPSDAATDHLQQQVELNDPAPLFRPTRFNSSDPALPIRMKREPGAAFRSFAPQYAFEEYDVRKLSFPEPIQVPNNPIAVVDVGERPYPFFGFGRINYAYSPLSARLAYLEVVQMQTGRPVISTALQAENGEKLPSLDWERPLELLAAVDATGLIGDLTVTTGSGVEQVDEFFRRFIAKNYRLGARLAPGFYALRVGP